MITICATRYAQLIRPYFILGARLEKYMRISPRLGGRGKETYTGDAFLRTEANRGRRVGAVVSRNPVVDVAKPSHRANADPFDPLALGLREGIDIVIDH